MADHIIVDDAVDRHFKRKTGTLRDELFWKQQLLENTEIATEAPWFLDIALASKVLTYDTLKCIELQLMHSQKDSSLFEDALEQLYEMFMELYGVRYFDDELLIVLNILISTNTKSQRVKMLLKKQLYDSTEAVIKARVNLLLGEATVEDLIDEDDLIVYYLNNSKSLPHDFDQFASKISYNAELLLDFILYDDEKAAFLQVLLKLFKQKSQLQDRLKLLNCINSLVQTLQKCKKSLPYDPSTLIKLWHKQPY